MALSGHMLCPVPIERAAAWCVPCSTVCYSSNSLTCSWSNDHIEQRQLHIQGHAPFHPMSERLDFIGNRLSILLLFCSEDMAFIKMPLHWPPPPPTPRWMLLESCKFPLISSSHFSHHHNLQTHTHTHTNHGHLPQNPSKACQTKCF